MKNLHTIILVLLSVILFSCNKDEGSDLPTETIKIEDDLKINFADLTAVTIQGEAKVDAAGNFNANTANTLADNLPLLFLKDNEIMFGYYSKTGSNNSIAVNDILLFYFTLHPEIVLQGFQNAELLDKIKQNSNYDELTSLIKTSLNANTAPLKNASFVNLLNKTGLTIGVAKRQAKIRQISTTQSFDFRYRYTRDGTIEWDKKFPLYATVGMEVVDTSTGLSVSGPQIFDNSAIALSLNSWFEYVYNYLTTDKSENIGTYKLPKEGKYEIRFTNGVDNFGTKALEEKVDLINRYNIGVQILSIAMPIGTKKWLTKNDCRDATIDLFKNMKLSPVTLVITDNTAVGKFTKDLARDAYVVAVKCIPSVEKKYLDYIEATLSKYFNIIEETSTLYLSLRDYAFSDIKGKETRNFYDGVSFGELQLTNTTGLKYITPSGTEFSGQVKSEHTYTASVNETTFKYSINRGLQSTITVDPASKEYAIGLPFEVTKTNSGDATLKGNKIIPTAIDGKLAATFVMGTKETKFEIKPAFKNSGLTTEVVNLKEKICDLNSILGTYVVEMYNTCYPNPDGTPSFSNTNTLTLLEGGKCIFTYYDGSKANGTYTYNNDCFVQYSVLTWCSGGAQSFSPNNILNEGLKSCGCLSLKHIKK
jgi:hypothetical protein